MHGHGGLDEASLSGASQLRLIEGGQVRSETMTPEAVGLAAAPMQALVGGDLADNQAILEAVLQGRATVPQRDVVALNTALVLWAAGLADSVRLPGAGCAAIRSESGLAAIGAAGVGLGCAQPAERRLGDDRHG